MPLAQALGKTKKNLLDTFQEDALVILKIESLGMDFEKPFENIHHDAVYQGLNEKDQAVFSYNGTISVPYKIPKPLSFPKF